MTERRVEKIIARLDALLSDIDDNAHDFEWTVRQLPDGKARNFGWKMRQIRDAAQELKWAIENLRKEEIEND